MSIKGKAAAKLAAKTGGKAVPGVGQAIMVVEGAPVALEEGTRAYQIFMEEKKKADKLAREGKPFRSIKAYYEAQAKSQSAAVKGIGRTAVTALVARQAADSMLPVKARKNGNLVWRGLASVRVLPGSRVERALAELPELNLVFLVRSDGYGVVSRRDRTGNLVQLDRLPYREGVGDLKAEAEQWLEDNHPLFVLGQLAKENPKLGIGWTPRPGESSFTQGACAEIPELRLLVVVTKAYPDGFRAKIWQRKADGYLPERPLVRLGRSPTMKRLQKHAEDWIARNYPLWALGQLAKENSPKQDPDAVLSSRYPLASASVQRWFNPEWTALYSGNYANVYVLPNGLYVRWDEDAGPPNQSKGTQFVVFGPGPTDDIVYVDPSKSGFTLHLQKAGQMAISKPKSKRPWQARRNPMMSEVELYQDILAHLRALQWVSWTSHWTASGPSYYGDHRLLQRLYTGKGGPDINEEIDALGERMVAYFGPPSVDPEAIVGRVHQLTGQAIKSSTDQFEALLMMETQLQQAIQRAWKANQASGEHMSLGIDDMLMGLANEREAAIYLLQRRLGGRKPLAGSVGRAAVAPPAIPESLRTVTPRVDLDESFTPQPLDRSFRAFSKSLPRPRLQAPELAAANPALPPGFSLQRGEHRGRPVFRIFRMGMDTGKYALRGERAAELAYKMARRA